MAPRGFHSFKMAMPLWLREKLFQRSLLHRELKRFGENFNARGKISVCEHHLSHAASAFFPSPYENAAILTMDGVGEWATTSAAMGNGNRVEIFQEIHFPHSLGLIYSAFTYYTGFKVNSGETRSWGSPLWRAEIQAAHPRQSDRSEAGRLIPAQHGVFRLLRWADDDESAFCQALRRAG